MSPSKKELTGYNPYCQIHGWSLGGLIRIDTSNLNYYAFICLIFIICLSIKSSFVHSTEKNATMRQSLDTPYSVQ